jgi:hypothetical protein
MQPQTPPRVQLPAGQPHLCKRPDRLLIQVLPMSLQRRVKPTKPRLVPLDWEPTRWRHNPNWPPRSFGY